MIVKLTTWDLLNVQLGLLRLIQMVVAVVGVELVIVANQLSVTSSLLGQIIIVLGILMVATNKNKGLIFIQNYWVEMITWDSICFATIQMRERDHVLKMTSFLWYLNKIVQNKEHISLVFLLPDLTWLTLEREHI